jgi:hypothetical protein
VGGSHGRLPETTPVTNHTFCTSHIIKDDGISFDELRLIEKGDTYREPE